MKGIDVVEIAKTFLDKEEKGDNSMSGFYLASIIREYYTEKFSRKSNKIKSFFKMAKDEEHKKSYNCLFKKVKLINPLDVFTLKDEEIINTDAFIITRESACDSTFVGVINTIRSNGDTTRDDITIYKVKKYSKSFNQEKNSLNKLCTIDMHPYGRPRIMDIADYLSKDYYNFFFTLDAAVREINEK